MEPTNDQLWWYPGPSPREVQAAERRELADLRSQVALLRAQCDESQRQRTVDYEAGRREGERNRGLPSILAR